MTYGEAGNVLLASNEMIVGKTSYTTAISLMPGISPEALTQQVKTTLNPDVETIIFTNIYGSTSSNIAYLLSRELPIRCISGANLVMLIEANTLQDSGEEQSSDEYT